MPKNIYIFKRVEKKYIISKAQREALFSRIKEHVVGDEFGRSTICSAYLDTDDYRIIRASIDTDNYKEKLRIRSYGMASENATVYLEIKKKCDGIVYKRRVPMKYSEAVDYVYNGAKPPDSQIMREIDYAMKFYDHPLPRAVICYEREAYYIDDLPAFRITFDDTVRCRTDRLDLTCETTGIPILPPEMTIMEIKTDGAMPLWLSRALDSIGIFPSSFSKYGTAFQHNFYKGASESCQIFSPQLSTVM